MLYKVPINQRVFCSRKFRFNFVWIALLLTACDQASKRLIEKSIVLHDSIPVIPNFFNVTYRHNPGAAFGFLADLRIGPVILTLLTLGCVVFLARLLFRHQAGDSKVKYWGMTLILGGAIGNLFDRAIAGRVTDWIDFHFANLASFPTFNLADTFITLGVTTLMFASWNTQPQQTSLGESAR